MDFTRSMPSAQASGHAPVTGATGVVRWRRYVATGDSCTEGLWDVPDDAVPAPGARGVEGLPAEVPCRGWADLLAAHLAERLAASSPEPEDTLRYANLAVRGKLLRPILRGVDESLREP